MKKLMFTLFTAMLCLGFNLTYGQILVEGFGYAVGDNIGGNTSSSGTTNNNWTTHSNSKPGTIDIIAGSLTYPGVISADNKILLPGDNTNVPRDVNRGFTPTTASFLYFSALIDVIDNTQISTSGDYFMHFGASSGATNTIFGGRLGVKSVNSGANYRFIIQNTSTGTITFTEFTTDLNFGSTHLVVVKYDRSTSPTTAYLWVDPDLSLGETFNTFVTNNSGTASFSQFASICLRNTTNTPKAYIDEIRVTTSWTDIPLPIQLSSFTANVNSNKVNLFWTTASETNNAYFLVLRDVNNILSEVGRVQGSGTTTEPKNYSFTDINLQTGKYHYKLKQVDFNGNSEYFSLNNEVVIGVPNNLDLVQNYPNPFNPKTLISFMLPQNSLVSLKVYNILGQEIAKLINENMEAGYHNYNFDASSLSSGMYFYSLTASGNTIVKKMTVVK